MLLFPSQPSILTEQLGARYLADLSPLSLELEISQLLKMERKEKLQYYDSTQNEAVHKPPHT